MQTRAVNLIANFMFIALKFAVFAASSAANQQPTVMLVQSDGHETNETEKIYFDLDCEQKILAEKEYVILENGSLLLPQNQHLYNYETYLVQNDTAYICATDHEVLEIETTASSGTQYSFSKEFLGCGHILIDPGEFKLMKNGTLFIEIYGTYYEPTDYYIQERGVFVCIPDFEGMRKNLTNGTDLENAKFSDALVYVSHIGMLISIVSLILHLIVFCCVSKVRNLPGCSLASLSLSLLLAYLCFISSAAANSKAQCADIGLVVYYFFLTSFFWMNAIAFDVWRSFRVVVRELRISSHRVPWRRFLVYSLYSWLIPAALVAFARIADNTDILPKEYRPSFGSRICWFGQRKALLVFFAAPLCFVMILNAIFFLDSAYVINVATMKTPGVNELVLRRRFFMFMRLALLMGLTWIVGIVAGYVDNQILWYVFVILNTLQGLFIFIVFSCSSKVRVLLMNRFRSSSTKTRQSTSVRTISQVSGAL